MNIYYLLGRAANQHPKDDTIYIGTQHAMMGEEALLKHILASGSLSIGREEHGMERDCRSLHRDQAKLGH
jgi:hypothetical protein